MSFLQDIFHNNKFSTDEDYDRRRYKRKNKSTGDEKPCRACSDYKKWMDNLINPVKNRECPLDKSELGNRTWGFLHTMAAYYPENPSIEKSRDMKTFLTLFSQFYPCTICADDFQNLIQQNPPSTNSQNNLKQWLCWAHNQVNEKLGKPVFDCSKIDERWKVGWKDGSCD